MAAASLATHITLVISSDLLKRKLRLADTYTLKVPMQRLDAPLASIEEELRRVDSLYRAALSGAVVAKARYLALQERPCAEMSMARARLAWKKLEARRAILAMRRSRLEALEQDMRVSWCGAADAAREFRLTPAPGRIS
jgi:hypothetical protein